MNVESEARLALARRAAEILQKDDEVKRVWLFGSTAHDRATHGSDIDIAVVVTACLSHEEEEYLKQRFAGALMASDSALKIGDGNMQLHIGIITVDDAEHPRLALEPVLSLSITSGVELFRANL